MDVIPQRSSTLNPNAPMFVPSAYRTVEDFSDQWWALVQSSPWFRDYWLRERFHDPQNDDDLDALLFDEDFFEPEDKENETDDGSKEVVPMGAFKWRKDRAVSKSPRFAEKAPKIVNVKVSPRTIHQPR